MSKIAFALWLLLVSASSALGQAATGDRNSPTSTGDWAEEVGYSIAHAIGKYWYIVIIALLAFLFFREKRRRNATTTQEETRDNV